MARDAGEEQGGQEGVLSPIPIGEAPQSVVAHCVLTRDVSPGTPVRLAADSLRSFISGFMPERIGPTSDAGASWCVHERLTPEGLAALSSYRGRRRLLLARCPGAAAGDEVAVRGTFHLAIPGSRQANISPYAGLTIRFRLEIPTGADLPREDEAEAWQPASDWFGFVLAPGPLDHLEAFIDSDGRVAVGCFDQYVNPVATDGEVVEVIPPHGPPVRATVPPSEYGTVRVVLPSRPAPGSRVTIRDARGRVAVSAPAPVETPEGYRLLFGEFHWHTEASGDGTRSLADAYGTARDGQLLDYAGASDHYPFQRGLSLAAYADIADSFDEPGRFVTLLGAELSQRMGHYNFYWLDRGEVDRFAAAWEARGPGPLAGTALAPDLATFYGLAPSYFEQAQPGNVLIVPHHTNINAYQSNPDGLPVWTHYGWPLGHRDPRLVRLGEMIQTRGCFETEEVDGDWFVVTGACGGSLRTALARGFRVGFTAGTDNHCGWPARTARGWSGLTAIYAAEFSRAGIMAALYARRCYATSGARVIADFRLNGAAMGSELRLAPGVPRLFTVQVHGTAPLERAEVVSQGVVIVQLPCDGPDLVTEWSDARRDRPAHDCYYYLRVRQVDGHCAWTSPIWVDLAWPAEGNTPSERK